MSQEAHIGQKRVQLSKGNGGRQGKGNGRRSFSALGEKNRNKCCIIKKGQVGQTEHWLSNEIIWKAERKKALRKASSPLVSFKFWASRQSTRGKGERKRPHYPEIRIWVTVDWEGGVGDESDALFL